MRIGTNDHYKQDQLMKGSVVHPLTDPTHPHPRQRPYLAPRGSTLGTRQERPEGVPMTARRPSPTV